MISSRRSLLSIVHFQFIVLAFICTLHCYSSFRQCTTSHSTGKKLTMLAGKGGGRKPSKPVKSNAPKKVGSKGRKQGVDYKNAGNIGRNQEPSFNVEQAQTVSAPANFASKTVWGQNVINIRPFSIESHKTFEFVGSYKNNGQIPIFPSPEIAFLGRSNVGKSSLLNQLTALNKNIAVVGKTPGRTQSINLFKCSERQSGVSGSTAIPICIFVDLPGYGFAKMAKSEQAEIGAFIEEYLKERGALRVAVLLVDTRRYDPPMAQDGQMIQVLEEIGIPYLVVATKVDQMKPNERDKALSALRKAHRLPPGQPIAFSSITGEGRKDIWRALRDSVVGDSGDNDFGVVEDGQFEEEFEL